MRGRPTSISSFNPVLMSRQYCMRRFGLGGNKIVKLYLTKDKLNNLVGTWKTVSISKKVERVDLGGGKSIDTIEMYGLNVGIVNSPVFTSYTQHYDQRRRNITFQVMEMMLLGKFAPLGTFISMSKAARQFAEGSEGQDFSHSTKPLSCLSEALKGITLTPFLLVIKDMQESSGTLALTTNNVSLHAILEGHTGAEADDHHVAKVMQNALDQQWTDEEEGLAICLTTLQQWEEYEEKRMVKANADYACRIPPKVNEYISKLMKGRGVVDQIIVSEDLVRDIIHEYKMPEDGFKNVANLIYGTGLLNHHKKEKKKSREYYTYLFSTWYRHFFIECIRLNKKSEPFIFSHLKKDNK